MDCINEPASSTAVQDTWITPSERELRHRFHALDCGRDPEKNKLHLPSPNAFSHASILMPLFYRDGDLHVLLTVRSKTMSFHAGIVAFPGGMREEDDIDAVDTALREAEEEIGLMRRDVQILGTFTPAVVRPNNLVTPVLGLIPENFVPVINEKEVELVFDLPLRRFLSKDRVRMDNFVWPIQPPVTFNIYHFLDHVHGVDVDTWGFTALRCTFLALVAFDSPEDVSYVQGYTHNKTNCFTDVSITQRFIDAWAKSSQL